MKKLLVACAIGGILVGLVPMPAQAGAATDAALGLAAFAVFNQLFGGWGWAHGRVVVAGPPVYYSPYPVVYAPPAVAYASPPVYAPSVPALQREVVYSHGRHVLQGDGVRVPYQWVWLPNPPPPPPGPAPVGPPQTYWHYCPSAKAYYPNVQTCPEPWVKVPPRPA